MSEFEDVQEKFFNILMHLGTEAGTSAVGKLLPSFIAALLSTAPNNDEAIFGLNVLMRDVKDSLASLRDSSSARLQ